MEANKILKLKLNLLILKIGFPCSARRRIARYRIACRYVEDCRGSSGRKDHGWQFWISFLKIILMFVAKASDRIAVKRNACSQRNRPITTPSTLASLGTFASSSNPRMSSNARHSKFLKNFIRVRKFAHHIFLPIILHSPMDMLLEKEFVDLPLRRSIKYLLQ